jgi:hypothetical protein
MRANYSAKGELFHDVEQTPDPTGPIMAGGAMSQTNYRRIIIIFGRNARTRG